MERWDSLLVIKSSLITSFFSVDRGYEGRYVPVLPQVGYYVPPETVNPIKTIWPILVVGEHCAVTTKHEKTLDG